MLKRLLIISVLTFTGGIQVQAALIDNDSYTTDSVSGLDWLDLNYTINMSYTDALANNTGWRYATNDEVVNLFNLSFENYVPTDTSPVTTGDISFGESADVYPEQVIDANKFQQLFGPGSVDSGVVFDNIWYFRFNTTGLYQDNSGTLKIMGALVEDGGIDGIRDYNPNAWTEVYGVNGTNPFYEKYRTIAASSLSTYLVRESSVSIVPVPSAILLFGSGLACLIRLSTYKRSKR